MLLSVFVTVSGGRSISSESLAALALHLLLKRRKQHVSGISTTYASSSSVLQITENKSSSLEKPKVFLMALDEQDTFFSLFIPGIVTLFTVRIAG